VENGIATAPARTPGIAYTVESDPAFTADQVQQILWGVSAWTAMVPSLRLSTVVEECDGAPSSVCFAAGTYPGPTLADRNIDTSPPLRRATVSARW
jgi:hypothetical protein